jgi:hypothetical protein
MTFRVFAEAILFTKEVYAVAERKGIHGELAGFMDLHSRLEMTRFGGLYSILFARDCRKLSHGTEVSSCSSPKDIGSCFCSLVFHLGPATFFSGRVTQTRILNGFVGVEGAAGSGGAATSGPIDAPECASWIDASWIAASQIVTSLRVTSLCTWSRMSNRSKKAVLGSKKIQVYHLP